MYFKKLEIFGFKSFADKTVLNFERGITAVVGPNGCGKSNIFDSIRWVLGEQSVKELRGSTMEDVIFNGTDKKPALSFAEVSLTLSNESKSLPIEYDEVVITRRLYRSGESEYLLNKGIVRLKDIQELLMGTGIGAEAYSLIQQGKVDLVVSARPEDRRIILDEASGITKYKTKKREALNKLKDTENNLLRINDIIIEVKRQISSIERQANKARKYKVEFEKLKRFEVKLAEHELKNFSSQKDNILTGLSDLQNKESDLNGELEQLSNLIDSQSIFLEELEQKINEVNSEDIKLEGSIDISNKQIGFNEERIENLSRNTVRLEDKKKELIERCRGQQEKIEEIKNEIKKIEEGVRDKTEMLGNKRDGLHHIESAINQSKKEIRENEEKVLEVTSQQVSIKNGLTEVMKEFQGALARKRRLDLESTKVCSEKEEIDERLKTVSEEIGAASEQVNNLRREREIKIESFNETKANISSTHRQVNDLEKHRILLKSQKEFIEKLQVQYKDIPDPIIEGHLITNTPPSEQHSGIIGKVKEVVALDEDKMNLLRSKFNHSEVRQLYEVICEAKFIELDPQQLIVKIEDVTGEIEQKTREKEELITRIEQLEVEVERLGQDLHSREKELSILQSQKGDISEEANKLVSELELVDSEIVEVKENLSSLKKKEDELIYHLDTLNQELESSQNSIKNKQDFIALQAQEREESSVLIAQLEAELESHTELRKGQEDNLKVFGESLDIELSEIKRIDDDNVEHYQKKIQYEAEIVQLRENIETVKEKKQSLKTVLVEHEKQKEEISRKLNGFRSELKGIEEEIEVIKQNIHDQQMRDQELAFSEKGIKDRLVQTYKIDITEDKPEEGQEEEPLQFEVGTEEFITEIERLKKRCDSFGSVNLVAIEEFEELKGRYEFLTKQQSDLLEAKVSLHQTINKINRKTRQMFLETFTRVSEEFRIYFRMLFGGGEAQLVLMEPDNVLESGIEIIARPPGKKLQNISLLSGGEKSLTAIALVFGVFKVRPSPFCILDEIDAALDESNVGRYGYLLKDFSKIAQFIVITHNKKTIENANVMYGITMQERGVSKIVSVKLSNEEEKEEKEAPAAMV